MSEIEIVDGANHLDEVKRLVIEYTKFLGRDLSFQHLDDELNDLSAKYTPPEGKLLCARLDGEIIGCVAYHKHTRALRDETTFRSRGLQKFSRGQKTRRGDYKIRAGGRLQRNCFGYDNAAPKRDSPLQKIWFRRDRTLLRKSDERCNLHEEIFMTEERKVYVRSFQMGDD